MRNAKRTNLWQNLKTLDEIFFVQAQNGHQRTEPTLSQRTCNGHKDILLCRDFDSDTAWRPQTTKQEK